MADAHTCPSGHRWDGDESAGCPVCAAESRNQSASDTEGSDIFDEFPPPPSPGSLGRAPSPRPDAPAGSPTIPGYELLGELGRGGMGVVYKARQVQLDRLVALKVVLAGEHADPREQARFRSEAEAIARLQHPNIVQIFEVGEHDGRPFLALELLEGGTLADRLAGTPLPPRAAAELAETLARAVHSAHQRGVVHRDLKPANILFSDERRATSDEERQEAEGGLSSALVARRSSLVAKVTDFGLAKRLDDDSGQTRSGQVVGTPSYMAPEQAAGQARLVGPAADVYALGAILYECLTGRPPFKAATSIDTLLLVLEQDPVPPARLQPKVPRDLETVCLKCLAKEPRKRYPSAEALADDLRRFLDGRPVLARRTPGWERAWKWARRKPALAALIALAAVGAGVLGGLGYGHLRAVEDHNRELGSLNRELERTNAEVVRERDETRAQRDRAEANLKHAGEAVDRMLVEVGLDRLGRTPHLDRTRVRLLESALGLYDRLLAVQEGDPRLLAVQAYTAERTGTILMALGRFDEARQRFDRALALLRQAGEDARPGFRGLRRVQALIHTTRGLLLTRTGPTADARTELEAALAIREELAAAHPNDPTYRFEVAVSYVNLALVARSERDPDRVGLYLGRARQITEELTRDHPRNAGFAYLSGVVFNSLAAYCMESGDLSRAVPLLEKAIETWRRLTADDPGDLEYRAELARGLNNLGTVLLHRGYLKRAAGMAAEALAIREELVRDHPDVRTYQIDLASSLVQTADLHRSRGEHEPAAASYTRAIDRLGAAEPRKDILVREVLREAYNGRAAAFDRMDRARDAADDRRRAADLGGDTPRPM
jgi:serine/threonine-protein kinase